MKRSSQFTIHNSQFTICLALAIILLFLLAFGNWRSTATGAQVQVPMFYDAHYLFPRPWTQVQEVPGVPEPFPVAFYGPNTVSQSFVSGANHLTAVELWLQAPPSGRVMVALSDVAGPLYEGQLDVSGQAGDYVCFTFPTIQEAEGHTFQVTLAAPEATQSSPAVTRVVGGDRLGGRLRLNEYPRPGNLDLRTYVTGTAVADALGEQLLPDLFRERLRQYKPPLFKGQVFAGLLWLTGLLTAALFVWLLAGRLKQVGGWLLAALLLGGLAWQLGAGRVYLPIVQSPEPLAAVTAVAQPTNDHGLRVVNDLSAALWTAERLPEKRLVTTELGDYPAIHVPADSALEYALDLPLNGRLQTGLQAVGEGTLLMAVEFNGERVSQTAVTAGDSPQWLDLDLTVWQGRGGILRLVTEPVEGTPDGLWLMPQLLARRDWLLDKLPETAVPAGHRLGTDIILEGYAVEPATPQPQDVVTVTLYWRAERPLSANATVFVHTRNAAGEMLAQSDSQPVQNSYPLDTWPAGVIIADRHQLIWPSAEALSQIAVGLYDPVTLLRLPVQNPDGTADAHGQALLPVVETP
ncbi:MAG: hypothetical protein IPM53_01570 [Anaerolineaceae bacterium]|nr:hypothetical protein [Anaerolineaceae bacterium]